MEKYSLNSLMVENKKDIERLYTSEKELLEPLLYSTEDKNENNSDLLLNSKNLRNTIYLHFKEFVPKNDTLRLPTIMKIAMGLLKEEEGIGEEIIYRQMNYDLNDVSVSHEEFLSKTQEWIEIRKTNEIKQRQSSKIVEISAARKFGLPYKLIKIKGKKVVQQPERVEHVIPIIYYPLSVETIGYSQ